MHGELTTEMALPLSRDIGAQIDHDLGPGAAEFAHPARGDALDHVGDAVVSVLVKRVIRSIFAVFSAARLRGRRAFA